MGPIGKGPLLLATRTDNPQAFDARVAGFVAIYSALGLRDEALNAQLGQALMKSPFPPIKRLRRDTHESSASCWLHAQAFCLSLG